MRDWTREGTAIESESEWMAGATVGLFLRVEGFQKSFRRGLELRGRVRGRAVDGGVPGEVEVVDREEALERGRKMEAGMAKWTSWCRLGGGDVGGGGAVSCVAEKQEDILRSSTKYIMYGSVADNTSKQVPT